jgi:hypothetical protein
VAFFVGEPCVKAAGEANGKISQGAAFAVASFIHLFRLTTAIQPKVEKNKPLIYCVKESCVI